MPDQWSKERRKQWREERDYELAELRLSPRLVRLATKRAAGVCMSRTRFLGAVVEMYLDSVSGTEGVELVRLWQLWRLRRKGRAGGGVRLKLVTDRGRDVAGEVSGAAKRIGHAS